MTGDDVLTFERKEALNKRHVVVEVQGVSVGETNQQR